MAAKNDPYTVTILISPDVDWYKNFNPYIGPFPDTHVIAYSATDTITFEELTIPPELNITRKKPCTLQVFCIHHQNNNIGTYEQMKQLTYTSNNLQILQIHIKFTRRKLVHTNVARVSVPHTGL